MEPAELARRGADHGALVLSGLARGDQLSGYRAQQGVRDRGGSHRPHAAQMLDRPAEQGVVGESLQELGVVVVDAEHEAHPVEAFLAERLDVDRAVVVLPRARLLEPGRGREASS